MSAACRLTRVIIWVNGTFGVGKTTTVLHERHWDELESGLVARGHELFHVVLEADAEEVRRRIDADEVEVTAKAWRHEHLPVDDEAWEWLIRRADLVLDTSSRDASEVASDILAATRQQVVG
jgi:broad-specificity NMP kinase